MGIYGIKVQIKLFRCGSLSLNEWYRLLENLVGEKLAIPSVRRSLLTYSLLKLDKRFLGYNCTDSISLVVISESEDMGADSLTPGCPIDDLPEIARVSDRNHLYFALLPIASISRIPDSI